MLRDLFFALIDERGSNASVAILEATREPQVFEELRTGVDNPKSTPKESGITPR